MPEIWFPNLGIEIDHLSRTAFTVFGQDIYWYGIFIGLGVILGVLLALHEAKRTGQNPDTYLDFIIYAMIIAIIGAKTVLCDFFLGFLQPASGKNICHPGRRPCHLRRHHWWCSHSHCIQSCEKEKFLGYGRYHGTIFDFGADAGTLG